MSRINNYAHETEFRVYTCEESARLVDVYITFNIDEDDMEVLENSRLVFKKCYGIELGHITARILGTDEEYTPTTDDLCDWSHDLREALQKELRRQTA